MLRRGVHYKTDAGTALCGAELTADNWVDWTEAWEANCPDCLRVAAAESVDDRSKPHSYRDPWHCLECAAQRRW
jgi:hypothetical protein